MKVILKEDVQNLGQQGDVVEVKAGYARNYLMPKRLAILFTEQQQKSIEEAQKVELRKLEREKDQIDSVLKDIKALSLSLKMKSEEDNKLLSNNNDNHFQNIVINFFLKMVTIITMIDFISYIVNN